MKKLKYVLAALFILFNFNNEIFAKEIKATDIPNSTYVIGEHMFTRDINEDNLYKGQLTTEFIMITAKSIAGDKINDMIIYQKTARGKWINALTNKEVNPPESFEIIFKNFSRLLPIKYGDANGDGRINGIDVSLIEKYLAGWPDKNIIRSNCDVNGDTKITFEDVFFLKRIIAGGYYPEADLPNKPLGKTHYIEFANPNGKIYDRTFELNNYPIADKDYKAKETLKVFEGWYTDKELTKKYNMDTPVTSNLTLYAKFKPVKYGDANGDGIINGLDATRIIRYLANYPNNKIILENADVNGDGKVSEEDDFFLRRVIVGYYSEADLPNKPLSPTYTIMLNLSKFEPYKTTYEMNGYKIFYSEKIENPTKKGYIFEGWYTDAELTQKYNMDTPVTSNLTLYAKFKPVKYGDANDDGKVTVNDATCIMRYLADYPNNKIILENADVNGDGKVSEEDVFFLLRVRSGYYPEADLPNKPLSPTYTIILNLSEDEIYKTTYELKGHGLFYSEIIENPIKEGYIFKGWYTDKELTKPIHSGSPVTSNLTLYAKFVPVKYGDANGDGKVDLSDNIKIFREAAGWNEPGTIKENCDVNGDGKVTEMDGKFLFRYLGANYYPEADLPNKPLGPTYTIIFNLSENEIYKTAYEIKGHKIYEYDKEIGDPKKDGHTFEGWYTDKEFKNKFEVTTPIDKNLNLYAKFTPIA